MGESPGGAARGTVDSEVPGGRFAPGDSQARSARSALVELPGVWPHDRDLDPVAAAQEPHTGGQTSGRLLARREAVQLTGPRRANHHRRRPKTGAVHGHAWRRRLSRLREALVHMARQYGYVDADVDLL